MKLKFWQKIALPALLVVSFGIGLGGSIAWFDTRTNLTPQTSFEGVSEGAYFAYGNGKPRGSGDDEPYGISSPRHLYNLAWLQYLGLIDDVFNQKPATSEAYFELANDIDMTGWNLPPIGTTTNPFMGHFNGNGYTITGLTVSNLESDFSSGSSKKPERASSYSSDVPHIVGLFGVVGPYYGSGLAYSSSADAITDLNVSGITVKSSVDNGTLAGLVAGYVNGPISSVAISDAVTDSGTTKSTLNLHAANGTGTASAYAAGKNVDGSSFSRISEFGTVGYAETAYISKAKKTTSTLYGYNSEKDAEFTGGAGDKEGFGGSIDMKTMYNGIRDVWAKYPSDSSGIVQYPTKQEVVIDKSGQTVSERYTEYANNPTKTTASDWSYLYYQAEQKDGDKVTSSYSFARRTDTNAFLYLYGDEENTVTNGLTKTVLQETEATMVAISKKLGSNVYYVCYDNGLTYSSAEVSATKWVFQNGKIFYPDNSGNATTPRYLYKNGNDLGITTTASSGSTFTYDAENKSYYVSQSNTKYYLTFDETNTKWVFANDRTATVIYSGNHYMTISGSSLADTDSANAISWSLPSNGDTGEIYASVNGTTYYLRLYYGTVSLTTYSYYASDWTVSADGKKIYSDGYYLTFDNGWKVVESSQYLISDGNGHFLSTSSATADATLTNTGEAGATAWTYDGNFYVGDGYYLVVDAASPYYAISASGTKYALESRNSNYYLYSSYTSNRRTYCYLRYNAGRWSISTSQNQNTARNNATALSFTATGPEVSIDRNRTISADKDAAWKTVGNSYDRKSTSTVDSAYTTKPTYFPLRQELTGEIPNGIPQETNTGYVISGGNDATGDIRVSDYTTSQTTGRTFINRYGAKGIPIVYSRNDSGNIKIYDPSNNVDLSSNYEKFTTTRDSLEKVFLADSANIYGLHFVGATVSYSGGTGSYIGNSVYADKAIVNRETHYNYELPRDCIDFNLKEKGYVNFLAGTYFSASGSSKDNCFFSLHDIGRNADESINYIKEIVEIYEPKSTPATATEYKTYSYQYKYGDGTYSVPFKYVAGKKVKLDGTAYTENQFLNSLDSTNYNSTPKFKTAWIKKNDDLLSCYAYYFEIPINSGEYCLSSVANTNGAYMMYLDIGANAAKMNRTVIAEYIKEITTTWNFPKGLALVATGTSPASVNAYNSYCIVIDSSYGGTVTLSRESDTTGTATYSDTTNKIKMGYYHDDVAVTGSPNTLEEITPIATQTDNIRRITYFDYNTGDGGLTKIIVTRKNSETPTIERFLYDSQSSTWVIETDPKKAILYDSQGITVESAADAVRLYTEATMAACFTTMENSGTVVLGFKALSYASGTLTISYNLNGAMQQTGNGQFFVVSDYAINMTGAISDHVEIVSYVATYNTLSITFTLNDGTGATHTIVIPTP